MENSPTNDAVELTQPARRDFLRAAGALVVSVALPLQAAAQPAAGASAAGAGTTAAVGAFPATVPPELLDSWLAVLPDGSVIASVGKIEAGMGVGTSFAQMIAEELDVPLERVTIRMGDTATTVDQRGTGSSNGIMQGGPAMKKAGAEARQILLTMAGQRLGVPVEQLAVRDGVVSVIGSPARRVSYAELIGGGRFDVALSGKAKPKPASQYRIVGQPVARIDMRPKMMGAYAFMVDHKIPGMLHARMIRPPEAGAKLLGVVAGQSFPGLVRIVTRGDFVGVVCEREEQAIVAARELKLNWSTPAPMFSANYDALYDTLRTTKPTVSKTVVDQGSAQAGLDAAGARGIDVQYEYPFQSHACMGPACAVADVRADSALVWMGGQKPYGLRKAVAKMLKLPNEQVRVTWLPGPGSYGMNDADDAAMDAALLSQAVGKPVRLQYMRADGIAWDPKGPPVVTRMRGALAGDGKIAVYDMEARGYSGRTRPSGTDGPGDTLAGQLIGGMRANSSDLFQHSEENYVFASKRKVSHLINWEQSLTTGLRTAHLRDPDGMAMCFASECFVDEMAAAARADPVAYRLAHLEAKRDREVIEAAARSAGWTPRAAGGVKRRPVKDMLVTGRGIAYAPRSDTMVAIVAEVEVNMATGYLRVKKFTAAHDCGFVINPRSLVGTVEANLIQAMSRAMHEEVRFTPTRVTSVDWATYPVVDMTETPDAIDVVIVNNRPEIASLGAGEPSTRPVAAAIANAVFDATGVRLRRVPFTAESLRKTFAATTA